MDRKPKTKNAEYLKRWRQQNPDKYKAQYQARAPIVKKQYEQLRIEVLTLYGKGKLACVRCGFSDIRALSIDHIIAQPFRLRGNICGHSSQSFYKWLKRNNYPKGYQTLCMNCQFIKRSENHELYRENKQGYLV